MFFSQYRIIFHIEVEFFCYSSQARLSSVYLNQSYCNQNSILSCPMHHTIQTWKQAISGTPDPIIKTEGCKFSNLIEYAGGWTWTSLGPTYMHSAMWHSRGCHLKLVCANPGTCPCRQPSGSRINILHSPDIERACLKKNWNWEGVMVAEELSSGFHLQYSPLLIKIRAGVQCAMCNVHLPVFRPVKAYFSLQIFRGGSISLHEYKEQLCPNTGENFEWNRGSPFWTKKKWYFQFPAPLWCGHKQLGSPCRWLGE